VRFKLEKEHERYIPDDLAKRLTAVGGDLSRGAGFLKAHAVFEDYTVGDLEQERRDSSHLGL
jgi:hypothetical protein